MKIISVSIGEEDLAGIDDAMALTGFKSRSKLMRTALASLLGEYRLVSGLKGRQTVVFMITHKDGTKTGLSKLIHEFGWIIKTSIHHHTRKGCLDLLVVDGSADAVKELYMELKNSKGASTVSASVI